jgi:hypothetical protein
MYTESSSECGQCCVYQKLNKYYDISDFVLCNSIGSVKLNFYKADVGTTAEVLKRTFYVKSFTTEIMESIEEHFQSIPIQRKLDIFPIPFYRHLLY